MLKDVTNSLKEVLDEIFIISSDKEVLAYGESLNLKTIVEDDDSNLNKALTQAMEECKDKVKRVLIMPSDVPLIGKTNIGLLVAQSDNLPFIIVPAKGGGTNAILMNPLAIDMKFGDYSFIKHIKEAQNKGFTPMIHDSFYMAMDVNTTEDLGEILIHGNGSETQKYLKSIGITVKSIHGPERLKVNRE